MPLRRPGGHRKALLVGLAVLLSACVPDGCGGPPGARRLAAPPETPTARAPSVPAPSFPVAVVSDLPERSPATVVELRVDALTVDNETLIASWPPGVAERARLRGDAPASRPGQPRWPRLSIRLDHGASSDDALSTALSETRRAERASTGAGSGASYFLLRVADDVPFARVERVVYAGGRAGYGPPRWLVRDGERERAVPWPSSSANAAGPSAAEIERALQAARAGQAPSEAAVAARPTPERAVRLRVGDDRMDVWLDGAHLGPGCARETDEAAFTFVGAAAAAAVDRCLASVAARAPDRTITLEVAPSLPFGRLAPLLQHAQRRFESVRVVARGA